MVPQKKLLSLFFLSIGLTLSMPLTISKLIGSSHLIFTGINCLFMLFGSFVGIIPSCLAISIFFITKGILWSLPITAGIPTLLSTISFNLLQRKQPQNFYSLLLHVGFPIICISLFIIHPIGIQAWIYSMYWLIPMLCYLITQYKGYNTIVLSALGSTFIAHATGSIIWLYLKPTTAHLWLTLIPIVAIERITFACGAILCFYAITNIVTFILKKNKHKSIHQYFLILIGLSIFNVAKIHCMNDSINSQLTNIGEHLGGLKSNLNTLSEMKNIIL